MDNASKPHAAKISFSVQIHEKTTTGELSGRTLNAAQMSDCGVPMHGTLIVEGFSRAECVSKLKNILQNINFNGDPIPENIKNKGKMFG